MNYSLRQLRVFLAVARHGSFSRAADAVGLTQPAVSRAVADFEEALGVRLLDRTTREVLLTDAGEALVPALERLLGQLDDTLEETRQLGERYRGRVVIASAPTISARLMPLYVAACARRYPDIRLSVRDNVQADGLEQIRAGAVDFGVLIDPMAREGLTTAPLATDPFCFVCRCDHPLAGKSSVPWSALDGLPLVLLDSASGSRPLIDQIFARHGIAPHVVQEMGHSASVFGMVEAGIGASVLPSFSLPLPAASSLVSCALTPAEERRIVMVRREDRSLSPSAAAVWELVQELQIPGRLASS
ncbi:LysR family transcriptional regulator [Cupriavidus respiraculi]|uniref:HTH-type transcriptional regulator CynR n=1 Tax=Cupriavidus respiraculi TaxID=195930 RepID=A0ABN7YSK2_9BURK|nr:LysR family transcriptional regulator [Cupriavidus respiraculi]MBY4945912.1 LysR family transcriptional regulator [Cupriavidus respiraculi]CAG9174477.1 HTH-type transcriptional regulator CynR [Cupriavidus respiraculi]